MSTKIEPIIWDKDHIKFLDQRYLPHKEDIVEVRTIEECHEAIKSMVLRGAPLIGFSAIFGMALWVNMNQEKNISDLEKAGEFLNSARPTAVNLGYEIGRCVEKGKKYYEENKSLTGFEKILVEFALAEIEQLDRDNTKMAKLAEIELEKKIGKRPFRLMTLCNTGRLACGPLGTALGVISYLASKGKIEMVYASETRPYLQGGRLTAFELSKEGIEHRIVVEGAASYILKNKLVDAVFIGADRIVSNGDSANKIGSSSLAIICKYYDVPFYVVAPTSSFDMKAKSGDEVTIEMRGEEEVLSCQGVRIAPANSRALNPAFDITDHELIEGIFCEKGLIRPNSIVDVEKVVLSHD